MTASSSNTGTSFQAYLQSRSMGRKFLIVIALALLMTIPAFFVGSLLTERTSRSEGVSREVSHDVGGPQTFLGPTLIIPYTIASAEPGSPVKKGTYFVFPTEGDAVLKTSTQERRRSLFKVPIFQAQVSFNAAFDLRGLSSAAPQGAAFDWPHAEVVLRVSDTRGALAEAEITANGKQYRVAPATDAQTLNLAHEGEPARNLQLLGANASSFALPDSQFRIASTLQFSGAQQAAVLAYAKSTRVAISGDWPNPGFDDNFLPVHRSISRRGFTAEWSVPFIARGMDALGQEDALAGLGDTAMAVSFVEVADPYQSVSRSLKYVLLFVGLVFLSYFSFEVTTGKLVHPAQYVLVGVAQLIFYLLLLSLSERIGLGMGFLLAGSATVALLSINAKWVFESAREGMRALALFSALYSLIYVLLRLEDEALLLGAGVSFIVVAAAMYLTRQVNWYASTEVPASPSPETGMRRPG